MKRIILITVSLILAVSLLSSCGGKYDPIKSSDEDLQVIGTLNGYEIYFDELRFAVLNNKAFFSEQNGIDPDDGKAWEAYRADLEESVYNGIKYNCAIQILLKESGYSLDNESIQAAVSEDIKGIIDQCGSRAKYKKYLKSLNLTDRVLRFNISIAYASNELLYLMNDRGAFDNKVDFDIELLADASPLPTNDYYEEFYKAMSQLISGDIYLQAETLLISEISESSKATADEILAKAKSGEKLSDLSKSYQNTSYTSLADIFETDVYFDDLKKINDNDYTIVETDSGYRILKRLPMNMNYIQQNCYTISFAYVETLFKQSVSNYASTLTIEFSDFGKTLDITKIDQK